MTRWHLILSIAATAWSAMIGACSLLPEMAGLPDLVLLLAPLPAVIAAAWRWDLLSFPSASLPRWTRLLWLALLAGVFLVTGGGADYSFGATRGELAAFAPGWALAGVWFGYNAMLCGWTAHRGSSAPATGQV